MTSKNILVVGFGNRVRDHILPALDILEQQVGSFDIYARKRQKYRFRNQQRTTIQWPEERLMNKVDVIIVAITTENVPDLLYSLSVFKLSNITLLLDTPLLNFKDIYALGYFHLFKHVYVTEDFISMTPYLVMKKLIQNKVLGNVRTIVNLYGGYRYHGIALLRHMASQRSIRLCSIRHCHDRVLTQINFPNQMKGLILGPRDYRKSGTCIICDKGIISDYPTKSKHRMQLLLKYQFVKNVYSGFSLLLGKKPLYSHAVDKRVLSAYLKKKPAPDLICALKIEGLVTLFKQLLENKHEYQYEFLEALYDNLVISHSEKQNYFRDMMVPLTQSSLVSTFCFYFSSLINLLPISIIKSFHVLKKNQASV